METKKFTQYGTTTIALVIVIMSVVIGSIIFFTSETKDIPSKLFVAVIPSILIISVLTFLMYKLEIVVNDKFVEYRFGTGLWNGRFKLENIKSCEAITNSWFTGYGMRWLRNGWLYNVSGNKAIELKFYDRKGVVRIGTDKPEEVAAYINSKISQH